MIAEQPLQRPMTGTWNRVFATVGYIVLLAGVLPIFNLGWIFVILGLGFLLMSCWEPGHGFYLLGPLTALEVRPPLRRRAVWVKRVVVIIVASYVLFARFYSYDLTDLNRVAEANNGFVMMVGTGLVLYVFIIGLNNFTNQVYRYKSGKQWEVLRTTDLRHREIVTGLIIGKFPLILEPVLTITPLLMVMPLFGGVSPWLPLMVLLVAICVGLNIATLGTYFSLKRKTSAGAAGMCWAVYGVYLMACSFAKYLLVWGYIPHSGVLQWCMSGFGFNFGMSGIVELEALAVNCLLETCSFHAIVSLLFFLLATGEVPGRQKLQASSDKAAKVTSRGTRKRKAVRRPKMWNNAPIAWWQAMHWMNRLQSAVNRFFTWPVAILATSILIVCLIPLGISYLGYDYTSWRPGQTSDRNNYLFVTGIIFRVLVLVCLITTLFRGVKAILREKNADTWDSLLLTPISRKRIVYEKWWGVLLSERPAFYMLAVILLAQTATGLVSYTGTVSILLGIPAMMAFWGALGIYLSTRMRTVFQATTTAVVCVVVYVIAAGFLLGYVNSELGRTVGQFFIGFVFSTVVPGLIGFVMMEVDSEYTNDLKLGGMIGTFFGTLIHLLCALFLMKLAVNRVIAEKNGQPKR